MKHVVIGTAGHVDHGKTALVRALTGVDTDRLAEEKRRGLTIELGFARLDFPDGSCAGVVDVPGHEKFIKTMLAGAGGIDLAMLVVAADEGFMPQTVEHLNILSLLGVRRGVVVLTKCDLADADWLAMARAELAARVKGTFLENAPVVETSAATGQGIEDLREMLHALVRQTREKSARVPFRLPIDRVFSVDGFGTVVTGTLIMIACNYGVRNFQVSDIDEKTSFASYQLNRWLCGALALGCGLMYSSARGYDAQMATIGLGVYLYKVIDGVADVYEGRLQQADKLYLAGMSQTLRSAGVIAVFSVALFLTRSMPIAAMAMGIAAIASLVLVTAPLALLETEKSRRVSLREVGHLFVQCAPLFGALFLFNLIESMPKFVMEGTLAYKYQLYFNALFFPAQAILLSIGFIYKPQLLRLSSIWANPRKRRRFDLIIVAVMALIVVITGVCAAFMAGPGIPLMSFMYGLSFERYRTLALLMVVAGGVTAAIDFIYAIITVLRHAGDVTKIYLICFAVSVVLPVILIKLLGLMGAVASYLAIMALLLVLRIIEYAHIRQRIERDRNPYGA